MKTYIINMEKDVRKRALMEQQLSDQSGLEVTFFKAVEGRCLSQDELCRWVDQETFQKRYRNFATLPAIGCALSHWNLYNQIVKNDDPYALILEDDALLSVHLAAKIKRFESRLLVNKPIVILLTPEFVYDPQEKIANLGDLNLFLLDGGTMASGYLINKAGAALLKEKLMPVSYLADVWNEFIKMGLIVYGVVPHLISYPEGLGEIGRSQHDLSKKNLIKKIRHYLAGIKGRLWFFWFVRRKGLKLSSKNW